MKEKILIAMSGGVDSSATAALLKEKGYEVIGAMMRLMPENLEDESSFNASLEDAKRVADMLGIPFHLIDLRQEFKTNVIDNFINEYMEGRTPNPCVICNRFMKFGFLLTAAKKLGCDKIATGHYAKVEFNESLNRYILRKADDIKKDQTYFMYRLTQEQLKHAFFPLGIFNKTEIKEKAKLLGFNLEEKGESQEICFIPDDDYRNFLKSRTDKEISPGNFVDIDGKLLGKHHGIPFYTIGQRKGLGIALGYPAYIIEIRPEANEIVVGSKDLLARSIFYIRDINLIACEEITEPIKLKVKVRYRSNEQDATLYPPVDGIARVELDKSEYAITPGQSAVFYSEDIVVAGGIII